MKYQVPEFQRIPDSAIAKLLGLSLEEYHKLSHLPIEPEEGPNGEIIAFHMRISSGNNPSLLSKLRLDKNHVVKFKPDEVFKVCR